MLQCPLCINFRNKRCRGFRERGISIQCPCANEFGNEKRFCSRDQLLLNPYVGSVRICRQDERSDPRDVGSCHGCPISPSVLPIQCRAENLFTGRGDINGSTEIRTVIQLFFLSKPRNGDNGFKSSRIVRTDCRRIAGGTHQDTPAMIGVFYGIFYDKSAHRIPPTHINHACPIVGGINNSGGEIVILEIRTASILETRSERHQTTVRRDPSDPTSVVRLRSDDTGDVCSVSSFIFGIVIADCPIATARKRRRVAEIPSVFVVNVTVSVIVNTISWNLTDVLPNP